MAASRLGGSPDSAATANSGSSPHNPNAPQLPTHAEAVRAVSRGDRLGCFSGVPITFQARLLSCNCDVDGGGYQPRWFGVGGQPLLLVEPSETTVPEQYDDWLILALDPDGAHADVLPIGQIVDVTGMFDHPAARNCTYQGVPDDTAGPPTPSSACRFMFATTSISVAKS